MDVLRHTGRAELSSFVGGSAGNRAMDRTQWSLAPYTEADLQSQIDQAPALYGEAGSRLVADLGEYVAGINAYIAAARLDPSLMPGEYAAVRPVRRGLEGDRRDRHRVADRRHLRQGGGNELRSALTKQAFEKRFGRRRGRRARSDFRSKNDPEAPTTVSGRRFPSKARCRRALRRSLAAALRTSKAELYGRGPCEPNPQASCFDTTRSTIASAIDVPPFPFQNRPTFQQTVEVTRKLPR